MYGHPITRLLLALMGRLSITKDNHANDQPVTRTQHDFQWRSVARLFSEQRGCEAHINRQFADVLSAEFCIAYAGG